MAEQPIKLKEVNMSNHWCMCTKLKGVARDGKSTCSICGGRDAYGLSTERPEDKKKRLDSKTASTQKPLLRERVKNYPKVQWLLDKYADKAYPIIDKCDIEAALTEVLDDVDKLNTEQIKEQLSENIQNVTQEKTI